MALPRAASQHESEGGMPLTSVAEPAVIAADTARSGAAEGSGGGTGRSGADGWRAAGLFLVGLTVFLVALALRHPRFFWVNDKQLQYLPVFRWLGQTSDGVAPPLVDPDQGMAGNFAADPQYGVFDPVHWLIHRLVLATDDLDLASWSISVLSLVVLGLGICAVATDHRVRPVWAAAAALGAATSGWLLFVGASWWPLTWGTALLPWLWWGVSSRSRWSAPVAALAGYLLVSSGYPYALPFAVVLVVAVVAERLAHDGSFAAGRRAVTRSLLAPGSAGPLLAAAGGALAGSLNLWVARALQDVTQRGSVGPAGFGNQGTFVPNLLDALLGGPTLFGQAEGWWGSLLPIPVMATAWFAVPLLALAPWRASLRTRGVPKALAVVACAALATQTSTELGAFRFPVRYLTVLQVFLPLVTVLLLRQGWVLTRGRLALAGALVGAQLVLSLSRAPALAPWHVLSAAAVLCLLAVVVGGASSALRRADRVVVGAVLLLGVALLPLVGAAAAIAAERARFSDPAVAFPHLGEHDSASWPRLVRGFEEQSFAPGLDATVLPWRDGGPDLGVGSGFFLGSANLLSGTTPGFGYTSVGQRGWGERWCADYAGRVGLCPDADQRLLATAPGTDLTWLEVMSKDTLVLSASTPRSISDALVGSGRWREADRAGAYTRYTRTGPRPGRATWNSPGIRMLAPVDVGGERQEYDVRVDAATAQRVVLRDTWWPGYSATLDGVAVPTTSLDGTVVQVELPPGTYAARLVVAYRPAGLTVGLACVGVGLVLALVGVVLGMRSRVTAACRD